MKHYTFKQVGLCIADNKAMAKHIICPDTAPIGEFITVGNGCNIKLVLIKLRANKRNNPELASAFLDYWESPKDTDYCKCIQYVRNLHAYIFFYFTDKITLN